LFKIKKIKMIF